MARSTAQSECGELSTGTKISRYTGTSASGSCRAYTTLTPSPERARSYGQYGWCMLDCNGGGPPGPTHVLGLPVASIGRAPEAVKPRPASDLASATPTLPAPRATPPPTSATKTTPDP